MRVIDCDRCGETLTAANDAELGPRLGSHMLSDHEEKLSEDEIRELLELEAYDAMDS